MVEEITQSITKTRIDAFYEQRLKDSSIATASTLKEQLQKMDGFDWEEFAKPINVMDIQKVVSSVSDFSIGGTWKQKVSKNAPSTKSAIQSYVLDKSFGLGIGSGKSGDLYQIRGLKSRFSNHSYKFGDEVQKGLLNAPIQELEELRRSQKFDARDPSKDQDPRLAKKLTQGTLDFELFCEDQLIQEEAALEQVKYLYLLQHLIARQVASKYSNTPADKLKIQLQVQGSIQAKYDDGRGADVTKMVLNVDCLPLFADSERLTVVSVQDCEAQVDGDTVVDYQDVGSQVKSIQELLNLIRLKQLDIFVAIDSCCVKKVGGGLLILPKFKIVQTVLKDSQQRSTKHIGLQLFRQ